MRRIKWFLCGLRGHGGAAKFRKMDGLACGMMIFRCTRCGAKLRVKTVRLEILPISVTTPSLFTCVDGLELPLPAASEMVNMLYAAAEEAEWEGRIEARIASFAVDRESSET